MDSIYPPGKDDRPLLTRAVDIAARIVAENADLPQDQFDALIASLADPKSVVSDLDVLANAFLQAMHRLHNLYDAAEKPPEKLSCAWCSVASGSWTTGEMRSLEDSAKHTLSCEHNPLVVAARRMLKARDEMGSASKDDDDEFHVMPVGGSPRMVIAKEFVNSEVALRQMIGLPTP